MAYAPGASNRNRRRRRGRSTWKIETLCGVTILDNWRRKDDGKMLCVGNHEEKVADSTCLVKEDKAVSLLRMKTGRTVSCGNWRRQTDQAALPVFGRGSVWASAGASATLTQAFRGFSKPPPQPNGGKVPRIRQGRFLLNPCQFIAYQSYHSTLYCVDTDRVAKNHRKGEDARKIDGLLIASFCVP
jgi:hypothetical protein